MSTATKVVRLPARLQCSACGASTRAACECNAPYVPAEERAARLLAENPDWSDRAIGIEAGVSHTTVQKVRKSTGNQLPVRTGRDGKKRKLPHKPSKAERHAKALAAAETMEQPKTNLEVQAFLKQVGTFMADFSWRFELWFDAGQQLDDEARFALVQNLEAFSMELQRLAQKIDGR